MIEAADQDEGELRRRAAQVRRGRARTRERRVDRHASRGRPAGRGSRSAASPSDAATMPRISSSMRGHVRLDAFNGLAIMFMTPDAAHAAASCSGRSAPPGVAFLSFVEPRSAPTCAPSRCRWPRSARRRVRRLRPSIARVRLELRRRRLWWSLTLLRLNESSIRDRRESTERLNESSAEDRCRRLNELSGEEWWWLWRLNVVAGDGPVDARVAVAVAVAVAL